VIRVSVMYPNSPSVRFDMDYYVAKHVPMAVERFGDACKGTTIDAGLAGGAPGESAAFVAMVHFLFDSVESFQGAFGPHASEIVGDIPNYTDAAPVIQISDVKL
jgi:uncharacterized protein (TIGR02118 family)